MRATRPAPSRALLLIAPVIAALGGCLGAAPPVPRDHFYRVAVDAAPETTRRMARTISVAPIEAEGLLRERPMLFSSGGGHEVQQHDYYFWTEAPPRMLQAQLVDYLRSSGAAGSVITPDLRLPAEYEITGRIRRLERVLRDDKPRVVAHLELAMTEVARNRLVVVQSYTAERGAQDNSVEASVQALNAALSDIFARFLADADRHQMAQRAAGN